MENRYARYAEQPLQEERPFDFHTSNIQQARTKRLALCIVRLGNPILKPPEGRSLRDVSSVNGTQNRNAFSARKRYFVLQRLFFAYFFLTSQKKVCRRRHPAPSGAKTKPEGIRLRASFLIAAAAHTSRRRYPRSGRPLRPSARRNRKTLLPSRFRCCCARSEAPPL